MRRYHPRVKSGRGSQRAICSKQFSIHDYVQSESGESYDTPAPPGCARESAGAVTEGLSNRWEGGSCLCVLPHKRFQLVFVQPGAKFPFYSFDHLVPRLSGGFHGS
jgi:hypothetical protein